MKHLFFAFCLLAVAFSFSACKKCFHCYNSCQQCAVTINSHVFTKTLCVDSFASKAEFDAAIAHDTTIGYVCAATAPTYDYNFCVNQPGEKSYPSYFDRGQRATCDEK